MDRRKVNKTYRQMDISIYRIVKEESKPKLNLILFLCYVLIVLETRYGKLEKEILTN